MPDAEPISDENLDLWRAVAVSKAAGPTMIEDDVLLSMIARIDQAEHELKCTRLVAKWRLKDLQVRIGQLSVALERAQNAVQAPNDSNEAQP